jgi:hypothetical protein
MINDNAVTRRLIYSFSLIMCFVMSLDAFAENETPKSDEKPSASAPETEPKKTAEPKEKSLLEKLGDELMKEADDTPGVDPDKPKEDVDKMDRAVKGMRSAGEKLEEGQTADETQSIQKQVIKDLEDIINQLENPPPNQGNGGAGGGGGGGGGGGASGRSGRGGGGSSLRRMRPQGASGKGKPSGQAQKKPGDAEEQAGGTSSENGVDSSKMSQADRKAAEEAARKQKLEMDVWGHLPQHVREELLNTYGERMLPKYENLVKQFYEALSTQGERKKKK